MTQTLDSEKDVLYEAQLKILEELRAQNIDPYGQKFNRSHLTIQCIEHFEEGKSVQLAGRITACRDMGKTKFWDLTDVSGRIQLFLHAKTLNEKDFNLLKKIGIADILGVEGTLFKTKTGEISLLVQSLTLLCKALRSLPEKYHGMKDVESRYRQRYLDLLSNPDSKPTFMKRSKIIQTLRKTLDENGFLEVETPMLQPLAGGASAKPFITHHNALNIDLYLRIAPELFLKRLLVGGFEKVYEINRNFRNEGLSRKHNPEFTMLELYSAYDNYLDMMDCCEKLIRKAAQAIGVENEVTLPSGKKVSLSQPFHRITQFEAVKQFTSLEIKSWKDLRKIGEKEQIHEWQSVPEGVILNELFERYVEEKLIEPTFVTHYPTVISPLAKQCPENKDLVERFELFIDGQEIANAFSELNDPIEQKSRFQEQIHSHHEKEDEVKKEMDHDYVLALEHGMPPAGGLGIGIDRLTMMLTGCPSIREVILFPTLRPENK